MTDYTWPPKACPCGGYQRDGCEEHGCQWERDPSLVPPSLREPVATAPRRCPFCQLQIGPVLYARVGPCWSVLCNSCGAQGPAQYTEAEATAAWNTRAAAIAKESP